MKRVLLLSLGLLSFACGAPNQTPDVEVVDEVGDVDAGDFGLSATQDSYVIVRRDYRRCVSPLCGGYWVKDVNRTTAERYVNSLDFSATFLEEHEIGAITSAPDNDVILYGRLGKREQTYETRPFLVAEAYRGLPGVEPSSDDRFYSVALTKIACLTTPCHNIQALRINRTTGHKMVSDIVVTRAEKPLVDPQWLLHRVRSGRALVAGTVEKTNGARWLDVAQIYLRLPDRYQSCPKVAKPTCSGDLVPGWARNENRCLVPVGCVQQLFCTAYVPGCDEGYSSVSWENGCTRYACEPDFL